MLFARGPASIAPAAPSPNSGVEEHQAVCILHPCHCSRHGGRCSLMDRTTADLTELLATYPIPISNISCSQLVAAPEFAVILFGMVGAGGNLYRYTSVAWMKSLVSWLEQRNVRRQRANKRHPRGNPRRAAMLWISMLTWQLQRIPGIASVIWSRGVYFTSSGARSLRRFQKG